MRGMLAANRGGRTSIDRCSTLDSALNQAAKGEARSLETPASPFGDTFLDQLELRELIKVELLSPQVTGGLVTNQVQNLPDDNSPTQPHLPLIPGVRSTLRVYQRIYSMTSRAASPAQRT